MSRNAYKFHVYILHFIYIHIYIFKKYNQEIRIETNKILKQIETRTAIRKTNSVINNQTFKSF